MSTVRIYDVNEVISQLEQFHNRMIRIAGVLHIEFEYQAVLHFPSADRLPGYDSALWVDFESELAASGTLSLHALNGRRVIADATVSKEERGHMSLWPGGLLIKRLMKYDINYKEEEA